LSETIDIDIGDIDRFVRDVDLHIIVLMEAWAYDVEEISAWVNSQ
jgi:hypothetical protein